MTIFNYFIHQVFKALLEVGIKAGMYHGQMESKARKEYHRFVPILHVYNVNSNCHIYENALL